jgi:hypothetical protein
MPWFTFYGGSNMKMPSGSMNKSLYQIKELFFDRPGIIKKVNAAVLKKLNHIGGLIRKTARNSIKSEKGPSDPGKPPHSHTGLLKDHIYYGYDETNDSVVVGPCLLNRGTDAPHVLEYGGTGVVKRGPWRRGKRKQFRARPFMQPALDANKDNISKILENSLRR